MHLGATYEDILTSKDVDFKKKTHKMVSTNKFVVADSYIVCRIKTVFVFPLFAHFSQ